MTFRGLVGHEPVAADIAKRITLLHCTTAYPAPDSHANLRAIQTMAEQFGVAVGLSDHTMGSAVAVIATRRCLIVIQKSPRSPAGGFRTSIPSPRRAPCTPWLVHRNYDRCVGSVTDADENLQSTLQLALHSGRPKSSRTSGRSRSSRQVRRDRDDQQRRRGYGCNTVRKDPVKRAVTPAGGVNRCGAQCRTSDQR